MKWNIKNVNGIFWRDCPWRHIFIQHDIFLYNMTHFYTKWHIYTRESPSLPSSRSIPACGTAAQSTASGGPPQSTQFSFSSENERWWYFNETSWFLIWESWVFYRKPMENRRLLLQIPCTRSWCPGRRHLVVVKYVILYRNMSFCINASFCCICTSVWVQIPSI